MAAKLSPRDFVEALKTWSLADVMDALQEMETQMGIKPMTAVAPEPVQVVETPEPVEEQAEFTLTLVSVEQPQKLEVIKTIRALTSFGLRESKDLADKAPSVILEGVSKTDAENAAEKIKAAGGVVEIK